MLLDMSTSLIPQSNHGIMVEEEEVEDLGSLLSPSEDSSSSSSSSEEEEEEEEDFMEDGSSSASSSPPPASDDRRGQEGPLFDMSSLMTQLPLKRGLSRFYQGKSQSFTCMSSVRSLEDLVKPERRKSRSCGGNLDSQRSLLPKVCSKVISKKASKGSFGASISSRKHNSFMGSRPPMPPQRSNSISGQTLLFA